MMAAFMDHARNEWLARGEDSKEVTADRMLRDARQIGQSAVEAGP